MRFPETYDFKIETTPKAQALKVLEEASELVEATKTGTFESIAEEAADVLQALANYCECIGIKPEDFRRAYKAVILKNGERGRYKDHP